jgi:hypothetical protein
LNITWIDVAWWYFATVSVWYFATVSVYIGKKMYDNYKADIATRDDLKIKIGEVNLLHALVTYEREQNQELIDEVHVKGGEIDALMTLIEFEKEHNQRLMALADDVHVMLRSGSDLRLDPKIIERIEYLQELQRDHND